MHSEVEESSSSYSDAGSRRRTKNFVRTRAYMSVGSEGQEKDDRIMEVAFLSNEVREYLSKRRNYDKPSADIGFGAVLFVDISGFTSLGLKLRKKYKEVEGTERFARRIMGALAELTAVCLRWGGDVSKFAGDALLCSWKCDVSGAEFKEMIGHEKAKLLERMSSLARSAAYEMLRSLKDLDPDLSLHGGIGTGSIYNFNLIQGNQKETSRWNLLSGSACREATDLLEQSRSGVILYRKIVEDGELLKQITATMNVNAVPEIEEFGPKVFIKPLRAVNNWANCLQRKLIVSYIPHLLKRKMRGGGIVGGEIISNVAIMFVSLNSVQLKLEDQSVNRVADRTVKRLNRIFTDLTQIVRESDGEVRDLLFDDKGCMFIGVFGAHQISDKTEFKAILCSQRILRKIPTAKIGVSQGACFTGMCGTRDRHDFIVMGHEVNMAARYCQRAEEGELIASPLIQKRMKAFVEFEQTEYRKEKKISSFDEDGSLLDVETRVQIYPCFKVVTDLKSTSGLRERYAELKYQSSERAATSFVGRKAEIEEILAFIGNSDLTTGGDLVCIKGDQGIGKSSLVHRLQEILKDQADITFCSGYEFETNSPLFVFKQLVFNLLEVREDQVSQQGLISQKCKKLGLKVTRTVSRLLFNREQASDISRNVLSEMNIDNSSLMSIISSSSRKKKEVKKSKNETKFESVAMRKASQSSGLKEGKKRKESKIPSGGSRSVSYRKSKDVRQEKEQKKSITPRTLGSIVALESSLRNRSASLVDWENGDVSNVDVLSDEETVELDRFLRSLIEVTISQSSKQSLVIIIEDLHHLDQMSLAQFYELFSRSIPGLTYLLTYRSREYLSRNYAGESIDLEYDLKTLAERKDQSKILDIGRFHFVDLGAMSDVDSSSLAASILLNSMPPPGEYVPVLNPRKLLSQKVAKMIQRKTDGKPIYVVLLVAYYLDNNFIVLKDGKYKFASTKREEEALGLLPRSIVDIAGYRLNVLDGMQKRILKCAACIGKTFTEEELWSVLRQDGANFTEDELRQALNIIFKAGFVREMTKRYAVLRKEEQKRKTGVRRTRRKKTNVKKQSIQSSELSPSWEFTWAGYRLAVLNLIPVARREQIKGFLTATEERAYPITLLKKKRNAAKRKSKSFTFRGLSLNNLYF